MTEHLPYEEQLSQQWNELPLPDVNMAWADMKRRLDEDDDKPFLPFWLRGCAGWGLLGILLLGLGWWMLRPEKWFKKKQGTEQVNTVIEKNNKTEKDTVFNKTDTGVTLARNNNDNIPQINGSKKDSNDIEMETGLPGKQKIKDNTVTKNETVITTGQGVVNKKKKEKTRNNADSLTVKKGVTKNENILPADKNKQDKPPADSSAIIIETSKPKMDSATNIVKTVVVADPVRKVDSVIKKIQPDMVAGDKKPKKDSVKNKQMIFSAGLGLHQQLPVAGQKWSPYSSSGRKTSLADYIPSVYLRATKPGKWFFQSEFRYGAPQHTKEFTFRQTIVNDTPQYRTTTSSILKKTYYHQLPISFNYYVLPNWSIGAGMQWNNFYNAIAEREIVRRDNFLQLDSSSGKFIVPINRDSASEFRKSYWQAILQTQYQWKRFTLGARYSFGLQPYINFTLPGGIPQEEKNNSLQLFILFELWKSKKK